ncbi:MAG: AraC family transcriptional regulator [Candidatus Ruminococcus intestinipullorum]|nr:AraC family transcriptional regulator [Candidatus Ruminococcus intestinipullorum]
MQYINYRENRQRGTIDFPLEYHHVTPSHPQYVMSFHWHVEFELIRIVEGNFTLTIDEEDFFAQKNDILFVPAGSIHSGIPKNCTYDCIVFDMNMLLHKNDSCNQLIRSIIDHKVQIQKCYSGTDTDIHRIALALFDAAATRHNGYQLIIMGTLYQLFGTIFAKNYFNPSPSQEPRNHRRILQLKQALEFMESSYHSQLTLEEIAQSVNMSPKYFCRFFHEMTHRTPIDYLNYYRIERACYQLMTTELSITEIAFNSGFNDLSYFIKTFKKYKGRTPKKYLKE